MALLVVAGCDGGGGGGSGSTDGDDTRVGLTITSTADDPTSTNPIPLAFTFDQEVSGFDEDDISVTGGAIDALSFAAVSGSLYTADISPDDDPAEITVSVAAGVAVDADGNENAAAQFSITYQVLSSDIVLTGIESSTSSVTITWTDPGNTGFDHVEITCSGSTQTVAAGTETYEWSSLAPSTEYEFTVAAINGAAEMMDSAVFTVSTTSEGAAAYLVIYTVADLNAVRGSVEGYDAWGLDKNYILMADLDLDGYDPSGDESGWVPIGNDTANFTGTFLGNSHVISNLFINRTDATYGNFQGLFGYIADTGSIKDLGLEDLSVTGNSNVGGLTGRNHGALSDCHASGTVTATYYAGVLVGVSSTGGTITGCHTQGQATATYKSASRAGGLVADNSSSITDCYSEATVTGSTESGGKAYAGGLVGINTGGTITGSYATGTVSGYSYVGGLVAENKSGGAISDCYATGTVNGRDYIGGLGGNNSGATISDCHTSATVNPNPATGTHVGGLVGQNSSSAIISGCYASGTIEAGASYAGGLVGYNTASITESYASITVIATDYAGGLVGYNSSSVGEISNSYATGAVTSTGASSSTGGLVGNNTSASISDCYATGVVTSGGASSYTGGLVGCNNGPVSNCYTLNTVSTGTATDCYAGGLAGYNVNAQISCCYAAGEVTSAGDNTNTGGLVGYNYFQGSITNCYATAPVSSTGVFSYTGGLAGSNFFEATISYCYAAGSVSPTGDYSGGLLGYLDSVYGATVTTSFWDTQTTGQSDPEAGDSDTDGMIGKTTREMQDETTFSGWDFSDIWSIDTEAPLINSGYPYLTGMEPSE